MKKIIKLKILHEKKTPNTENCKNRKIRNNKVYIFC